MTAPCVISSHSSQPPAKRSRNTMNNNTGDHVLSVSTSISNLPFESTVGSHRLGIGVSHNETTTSITANAPSPTSTASQPDIPPPATQDNAPRAAVHPTSCLYSYLNKPQRRVSLDVEDYVTWDSGPDHQKWFTAVFVHTRTGECFPAGRFGDPPNYKVEKTGGPESPPTVWYRTKKLARHGAAA
jgi:hypothetical protein